MLAHGFLRAKCESCNFERLVALTCKTYCCSPQNYFMKFSASI
ncbi:MAG: hypothetical protein IPK04_20095 [Bdellovibrionales bacterium]|nr:hypothetical protein [Bdellovibrionales bacterium]